MHQSLAHLFEKIELRLRKQEDQSRFNFLKSLEGEYAKENFAILDPLNLQHHPFIKNAQVQWVQKMGVGSYSGRFQLEHIDLQNRLKERLQPKGFFSPLNLKEICKICQDFLPQTSLDPLFHTFEKDPLGLFLLGFESQPRTPLLKTRLGNFAEFYLVEEPLYTLLTERSPLFLLPPYVLAAIHAALDLLPSLKKERLDLIEKTTFIAEKLRTLDFDLSIQKFSIHINTSKNVDYAVTLKESGFTFESVPTGLKFHLRTDHSESLLLKLVKNFEQIAVNRKAIFC